MRTICSVLRSRGYEILEAGSAAKAFAIDARAGRIDLMIADVFLPEKSGVYVAAQISEIRPEMAVLFISGTPLEAWREGDRAAVESLPRTAWDFLQKPFQAAQLYQAAARLLTWAHGSGKNATICAEKGRLRRDFLRAIRELSEFQRQQTQAVLEHDSDFARFDILIHMASEKKDEAKYALMRHVESHHCEDESACNVSRWRDDC